MAEFCTSFSPAQLLVPSQVATRRSSTNPKKSPTVRLALVPSQLQLLVPSQVLRSSPNSIPSVETAANAASPPTVVATQTPMNMNKLHSARQKRKNRRPPQQSKQTNSTTLQVQTSNAVKPVARPNKSTSTSSSSKDRKPKIGFTGNYPDIEWYVR
jgi:hypothetical protein